ncbi:28201_t:CDS:1, partial [Gigaspora margarita]
VIHAERVIGCNSGYGPVFGGNFIMREDNKVWYYRHNDLNYEKQLRSGASFFSFNVFEVFQGLKD